jgi:dTDP-glucose pyrophosphorylase
VAAEFGGGPANRKIWHTSKKQAGPFKGKPVLLHCLDNLMLK